MSSTCYRIRIDGHLDQRWADWFGEMSLSHEADGTTLLRGPVVDQSALHELLQTIENTGSLALVHQVLLCALHKHIPALRPTPCRAVSPVIRAPVSNEAHRRASAHADERTLKPYQR